KKNENKAIEYFKKAAEFEYAYAYNNLGKIYENKKQNDKALEYYLISASLEESWACNKVGTIYLNEQNYKKAFYYFNLALNVPAAYLEHWALYNLAKHFYLNGCYQINLEKNEEKAINLFVTAKEKIPNALEELIYINIEKFKVNPKEEYIKNINNYLSELSLTPYYKLCKENIEKNLIELKQIKHLKIELKK
ncbi:MAG: sel1 repeat family protein, partial [Bacilli bacterium]|nr:sel1 repeat family protein [Bacilli bacterium]